MYKKDIHVLQLTQQYPILIYCQYDHHSSLQQYTTGHTNFFKKEVLPTIPVWTDGSVHDLHQVSFSLQ